MMLQIKVLRHNIIDAVVLMGFAQAETLFIPRTLIRLKDCNSYSENVLQYLPIKSKGGSILKKRLVHTRTDQTFQLEQVKLWRGEVGS